MLMDPSTTEPRTPRLAPVLLIGLLAWVGVLRPTALFGTTAPSPSTLATTLVTLAAIAYIAWRFHGLLPAAVALGLLWLTDLPSLTGSGAGEAALLAEMGVGIAVCARVGRRGRWPWLVLVAAAATAGLLTWFDRTTASDRLALLLLVVAVASVVIATVVARRRGAWLDAAQAAAILLVVPAVAVYRAWPMTFHAGDWSAYALDLAANVPSRLLKDETWCWTMPPVVVGFCALGLWRTMARGRREMKKGEPPLPWLLTTATLATLVVCLSEPALGSLILTALGVLLPVFGVADLAQAAVELVQLPAPPTGPSNVLRVK